MNIYCFIISQSYTKLEELSFGRFKSGLYLFASVEEGMDFCKNLICFRKEVLKTSETINNIIEIEKKKNFDIIDKEYSLKIIPVRKINGLPSIEDEIVNLKVKHEINLKRQEF